MATQQRRGPGDAKIFKASDGRWYSFIELPPGPDGRRRRKKLSAMTRGQVTIKRNTVLAAMQGGGDAPNDQMTVADAVEAWLASRKKIAQSTLSNYTTVARKHIVPTAVGRKRLNALTAEDVEKLLDFKAETLGARSVKLIRTILGASIGLAELRGNVQRNVVRFTEGPKLGQTKSRAMTEKQRDAVLQAAEGNRYEAAFRLMLVLGLRPGECLGLRWSDIDFEAKTLTVHYALKRDGTLGDVKNDGSRRQLPLPESAVPALMARMATQAVDQGEAAEYWQGTDDFVFTNAVGRPVSDRNLAQRHFDPICTTAQVGTWHLHECRHTAATVMLINRVPIEVVSKILGHRSIRQTADTYAHLLPRQLEEAVALIDAGVLAAAAV